MSNPQVIFEEKLAVVGRNMIVSAIWLLALWLGITSLATILIKMLCPASQFSTFILAVGVIFLGWLVCHGIYLCTRSGVYRIHLDDYGVYVQCDAAFFGPSFNVIAPDIKRLVRKVIKGDSDSVMHYIETKSGKQFRIEEGILAAHKIEVMDVFDKITERFTWVEIVEEEDDAATAARRIP